MDHLPQDKDIYWTEEITIPTPEIDINRTVWTTVLLTEITIYRKYGPPFSRQRKLQNMTVLATSFLEGDSLQRTVWTTVPDAEKTIYRLL